MKVRIALVVAMLALGVSAVAGRAYAQTPAGGKLRFVHALPGAPAVDVFVDNLLAARNLQYTDATRYLNVKMGDHLIAVTPVGTGAQPSGTPLLNAKVTLSADKPALLVLIEGTTDKPEAGVFDQDLGPIAAGNTRLTAVHAIKDAPAVDIVRADGSPLIQGLKYGDVYGAFDIPAAAPGIAIVPAGGNVSAAILKADSVPLTAGTANTIVALGTAQGSVKPSYILLTAPTDPNAATDVWVRFVNGVNSAKPLDLYVNGKLLAPDLAFGDSTLHLPLAAGAARIEARNAGDAATAQALGSDSLTLAAGTAKAQTVVVTADSSGKYAFQSYPDEITALDPAKARFKVINTIGGTAAVTLNGAQLASLDANKPSKSMEVPAGVYPLEAAVDSAKVSFKGVFTINGGTQTDLVLVGDQSASKLVVATTGLSEQPGSVPVSTSPVAAAPATAQPTAVAAVPQAQATTEQPPVATEAQPTAVPTATLVPTQPKPTVVPGIIGTVNTNPDVNLKIREYPRLDAKTLALVPSQSTLIIKGVRGPAPGTGTPAPTAVGAKKPTSTPTLVATARADVWLFVEWQTPDGGTVSGWANSQYLDLVNNGKPVRNLEDILAFKQIPENTPGEVNNSNITPVAADSNRLVGTINTNAGTNAQLRRTPGVGGESLALVPTGGTVTVLSRMDVKLTGVVGEPKSPTWYFVEFDSEGSQVFGWMSADFIQVTRKNQKVELTDIPVATEITRGFIQGNATAVKPAAPPGIIATVINVNQGANLQLRRDPNVNAESLALIPPDTQLPVVGRNGSGGWIQVSYQNQTGWVNSQFVTVSKAGKPFKVSDIAITTGEKNTFGTTTPTATPVGAG